MRRGFQEAELRVRLMCLASMSRLSLLAAWCVAASASPVLAQVAAGEITGIVKDQGGAAAPGATVTLTNASTNRQRAIVSRGGGVCTAPSMWARRGRLAPHVS